ncbi:MAG: hypothetical protein ACRCZI_05400 [Cetobacterium sp.]
MGQEQTREGLSALFDEVQRNNREHGGYRPKIYKLGDNLYEIYFDALLAIVIGLSMLVFGYLSFCK